MEIIYFWTGFLVLFLNKIRYSLSGYRRARDFSARDVERAVEYDCQVVAGWKKYLKKYAGENNLAGKNILELGPGEDLGTGLVMLSEGAAAYAALDANNLAAGVSFEFYQKLIKALGLEEEYLSKQVEKMRAGKSEKFRYVVDEDFDSSVFSGIDFIFSQAAFEHFDNLNKVASGLFKAAKKGAVLIAEIDLATHTGFLVSRDPLNIYRYPKFVYDFFRFPGRPNRLRPDDYLRIFSQAGWRDIQIYPLKTMSDKELRSAERGLSREFLRPEKKMSYLSIIFCAKK